MIRVSEIFGPTIQGEGPLVGQRTIFIRTGGCDFRCSWCDTPHAVLSQYRSEWRPTREADIVRKVEELAEGMGPESSTGPRCVVTISGGNPAIQNLTDLIETLHYKDFDVLLETQGSTAPDWLALLDHLVLSPKPPSSGMDTDLDVLDECVKLGWVGAVPTYLKIVVADDADWEYAKAVMARYDMVGKFVQPCNPNPVNNFKVDPVLDQTIWLVDKVLKDHQPFRVIPQLHTLLWGNARGV